LLLALNDTTPLAQRTLAAALRACCTYRPTFIRCLSNLPDTGVARSRPALTSFIAFAWSKVLPPRPPPPNSSTFFLSLGSGKVVIGTERWRSEARCVHPPAKAGHMTKRRVGLEFSPSMLEPVRPGAVLPDRALSLPTVPTFSHILIFNKTSLSLALSLALSLLSSSSPSS